MKRWLAALIILALAAGGAYWKREPLVMGWLASKVEHSDLAAREALLKDYLEIVTPEGDGPFPIVMLLHGCAGVRPPFLHQWADVSAQAGYAAVIVDSNNPRGFHRNDGLDIVCKGKALLGQERAGDIVAVFNLLKDDPRLDLSRLVVAGWSHGAWTTLDFLTMDGKTKKPAGLDVSGAEWPRIEAAIFVYPYCGVGVLTRFRALTQRPKMLALIAGDDEIVEEELCIDYFGRLKKSGGDVEVTVYPDANHVFDDPYLAPEDLRLYNAADHADATARVSAFLRGLSD
ncbi:MAG: prolyl oligopeptidase family serine peptidase [Parvularculaceae bacterium]